MNSIQSTIAFLALSTTAILVQAVESTESTQRQIDRALWQPFQCAFENMDGKALNKLYGKRVVRVTPEGIDTKNVFKAFNATRFDAGKARGDRVSLDFWLDSRATNSNTSYEVGFFRLGSTNRAGVTEDYYGQFHILLRKQRGRWKIVQDWDTNTIAGRAIGAEEFARGSPMETSCL